jgi:glycosyl transferase family 25
MQMPKIFVVHVAAVTARKKHMEAQLAKENLQATFMTRGDKSDLSQAVIEQYFKGEMAVVSAGASCALKHLYIYEAMQNEGTEIALVFEDDIFLTQNFNTLLSEIMVEIEARTLKGILVSLESTGNKFVARSKKQKDTLLYPAKKGRCAGAYLIDKLAAKAILDKVAKDRCGLPIDWFHNQMADEGVLQLYWASPAIAEQGSHNGALQSLIDGKKFGGLRQVLYFFKRWFAKGVASLS